MHGQDSLCPLLVSLGLTVLASDSRLPSVKIEDILDDARTRDSDRIKPPSEWTACVPSAGLRVGDIAYFRYDLIGNKLSFWPYTIGQSSCS